MKSLFQFITRQTSIQIQSYRPLAQTLTATHTTTTFRAYSVPTLSTMPPTVSPFTQTVVSAMQHLYPEPLADKSFDNTGLLLEAPINPYTSRLKNSVLLTIDLTRAVAEEALQQEVSIVVAYHPIIFRGLKSLTTNDSQQETLIRLMQRGVSVYCPHTAVDAVPGGMADWLCDILTHDPDSKQDAEIEHDRSVITSSSTGAIHAANNLHKPMKSSELPYATDTTGAGRFIKFANPQSLTTLIERIAHGTQTEGGISLAVPQAKNMKDIEVKSVGLCPGSGSSVLRGYSQPPDLVLTGELSHHEALAVTERGGSVITLFHSNSERGYLKAVMKSWLQDETKKRWTERRDVQTSDEDEAVQKILGDESVDVIVSEVDRDPYSIVIPSSLSDT